jgi:hypothetical protein
MIRSKHWVALGFVVLAAGCAKDDPKTGVPGGTSGATAPIPGQMPTTMTPGQPNNPGMTGTPTAPVGGAGSTAGNGSTPPVTQAGAVAPPPVENMPPVSADCGQCMTDMAGAAMGGVIPATCSGFKIEGIKHSPGGEALPNKCLPFHPTTNNPYAVRCIDVWPWYKTKYPGDNFCILPPPPDKGIQYGVHPQGLKWFEQVSAGDMSGYDNPAGDFVMRDGEEEEFNYRTSATNPAEIKFYRNSARMRGGSHHMIVSWDTAGGGESWGPGGAVGLGGNGLPGAQRPDENAPKTLTKPDEDKGLYSIMGANPGIIFNMHHFNVSGQEILKEAWTNLWFESDATIRTYGIVGLEFLQVATLNVPPGSTQDYHYSYAIPQDTRVVTLFGHRHAWTTNFTSWVEKPGGQTQIVYQSFNWADEPTYRYDSQAMNPAPAPQALTDGASSGILTLKAGETLHFNCHIEFTDERAADVNGPAPASIGTLRFANQAFNAEMCILFGSTAARSLGTPVSNASPLPDFATID